MQAAGFNTIADHAAAPLDGDPLWVVVGNV
jgi:hypothetical protein